MSQVVLPPSQPAIGSGSAPCPSGAFSCRTSAVCPCGRALNPCTIAGSYTACRTIGGSKGGRILKLEFHLDRLCSSLRLLFPELDIDGLEIPSKEDESPCAASDSIALVDVPAEKDALLVLFGGESRGGGQCAAEQLSLQLVQRCPGSTMISMVGLKPDILANHSGPCAIIRELPAHSLCAAGHVLNPISHVRCSRSSSVIMSMDMPQFSGPRSEEISPCSRPFCSRVRSGGPGRISGLKVPEESQGEQLASARSEMRSNTLNMSTLI